MVRRPSVLKGFSVTSRFYNVGKSSWLSVMIVPKMSDCDGQEEKIDKRENKTQQGPKSLVILK